MGACGVELLFPVADLGIGDAELAGGLGVGVALLGDELDGWTSPRKTDTKLRMFSGFELRRGNVPQR